MLYLKILIKQRIPPSNIISFLLFPNLLNQLIPSNLILPSIPHPQDTNKSISDVFIGCVIGLKPIVQIFEAYPCL